MKSEPDCSGVSMVSLAARGAIKKRLYTIDNDAQEGWAFTVKGACGTTRIINYRDGSY